MQLYYLRICYPHCLRVNYLHKLQIYYSHLFQHLLFKHFILLRILKYHLPGIIT